MNAKRARPASRPLAHIGLRRSARLANPMSRFRDPQDPLFQALNSSIRFDYRLAPYDLEQSLAHARMLASSGIIGEDDLAQIERGLAEVREEVEHDRFVVREDDEDMHMAIERRLIELIGPVGGKLHTARSRNDQVATDVAMLVRAHSLDRPDAAARADGHAGRACGAPPRLAAARLHAPPARPAGLPVAPPARLLLEVPARPPALPLLPDRDRRPAARRGRAGRSELRHRAACTSPRSSASAASPRTRSTRSRTATSCSTT